MSYAIIKNGQKNIVAGRVAPIVDRYSTDEVKTDKVWIDGKPIYRKCASFTHASLASGTVSNKVIDLPSGCKIVSGCVLGNDSLLNPVRIYPDGKFAHYTGGNFTYNSGSAIIVEYTKN